MEGDTAGNFNPKKELTRAEAAAVFSRLLKLLKYDDVGEAGFNVTPNILIQSNETIPDEWYNSDIIWAHIAITDAEYGLEDYKIPMDGVYPYTFASSDESIVRVDNCGKLYSPVKLSSGAADRTATITVTKTDDNSKQYVVVTVTPTTTYKVDDAYIAEYGAAMLKCVNEMRAENGLAALSYMPGSKAQDVMNIRASELETLMSYVRPDGSHYPSCAGDNGYYDATWCGEAETSRPLYLNANGEAVYAASATASANGYFEASIQNLCKSNILNDTNKYFGVGMYAGEDAVYIAILFAY